MRTYLLPGFTIDLPSLGENCYRAGDMESRLGFVGITTELSSLSFRKDERFYILALFMRSKYSALTLLSTSSLEEALSR
jgi:hypothetical protein